MPEYKTAGIHVKCVVSLIAAAEKKVGLYAFVKLEKITISNKTCFYSILSKCNN